MQQALYIVKCDNDFSTINKIQQLIYYCIIYDLKVNIMFLDFLHVRPKKPLEIATHSCQ